MARPEILLKDALCGPVYLLDDVQFEKREFQNRNRVRTARGWQYLTVPVLSKGRFSQKINEVELDNSAAWREDNVRALTTNYGRARYFKEYLPAVELIYSKKYGCWETWLPRPSLSLRVLSG